MYRLRNGRRPMWVPHWQRAVCRYRRIGDEGEGAVVRRGLRIGSRVCFRGLGRVSLLGESAGELPNWMGGGSAVPPCRARIRGQPGLAGLGINSRFGGGGM